MIKETNQNGQYIFSLRIYPFGHIFNFDLNLKCIKKSLSSCFVCISFVQRLLAQSYKTYNTFFVILQCSADAFITHVSVFHFRKQSILLEKSYLFLTLNSVLSFIGLTLGKRTNHVRLKTSSGYKKLFDGNKKRTHFETVFLKLFFSSLQIFNLK